MPSMSHGIPTGCTHLWQSSTTKLPCSSLDLLLQCRHWVGLHNGLRWLCLHLGLFAEHDPHTCFRSWLCPRLQAAEARDGKNSMLLDFCCCNYHEAVDDLRAS